MSTEDNGRARMADAELNPNGADKEAAEHWLSLWHDGDTDQKASRLEHGLIIVILAVLVLATAYFDGSPYRALFGPPTPSEIAASP